CLTSDEAPVLCAQSEHAFLLLPSFVYPVAPQHRSRRPPHLVLAPHTLPVYISSYCIYHQCEARMSSLTARQAEILDLIRTAIEETGMPPTRAEIAQQLGFRSANAAEEHLRALARKGVIELVPGTSRGIRLVEEDPGLPLVGRVAAGYPILAEQNIERHYRMDPALFRPKAHYLLKVQGMSMRDAGILDGDLLA